MWVLTGDKPGESPALLPQNACCTWGAVLPAAGVLSIVPRTATRASCNPCTPGEFRRDHHTPGWELLHTLGDTTALR